MSATKPVEFDPKDSLSGKKKNDTFRLSFDFHKCAMASACAHIHVPCEHEDLSLSPQNSHENRMVHAYNLTNGEMEGSL